MVNDTKVFPARLLGNRTPSGGAVECFLLSKLGGRPWEALVHPGQKLKPGARWCSATAPALHGESARAPIFTAGAPSGSGPRMVARWTTAIDAIGHVPLPPYIKRGDTRATIAIVTRPCTRASADRWRRPPPACISRRQILDALAAQGRGAAEITLHVGYGTFQPIRVERWRTHAIDPERFRSASAAAARSIARSAEGRRVVAVGTTTTRALEDACARADGGRSSRGSRRRRICSSIQASSSASFSALMTNFHLPKSSLLMLVAAFAGASACWPLTARPSRAATGFTATATRC